MASRSSDDRAHTRSAITATRTQTAQARPRLWLGFVRRFVGQSNNGRSRKGSSTNGPGEGPTDAPCLRRRPQSPHTRAPLPAEFAVTVLTRQATAARGAHLRQRAALYARVSTL